MDINHGKHVKSIIDRQPCPKHRVDIGVACYMIMSDISGVILTGVCNKRAIRAGANGKISASSYQTKARKFNQKS